MFKPVASALVLSALLTACASQPAAPERNLPAGVSFVEHVRRHGDELLIPYEKYRLANGLTVIIQQDHSDPMVHIDVTYHVGSAREELGKSGFAHFFEHMMFQGSEHVGDEQHFKIVSEAGGTLNGTTNSDRTNYFQTVPANQLETMLWLEADRMGFLLDAVTQQKFEVQRETVKNERGQRVDNAPYGRVGERVAEALYPAGHPYSWPVIGFIDDLNRVNVNDLKKFFLRWYGPNNAVLTVGGDVDVDQTLAWVNRYFGSIPRGPEVINASSQPATLTSSRYISLEDNVHLPLLYLAYPTVHARHADEPALDVLAEIIGQGKTSLLYKNLVKNQIAVQASTQHGCSELACTFAIRALPNPAQLQGKTLADLEQLVRASLLEFEQRGVAEDDLVKAKAKLESQMIFGLQSIQGKVSQLAFYETFTGNANYIQQDIESYTKVSKADVMRVYHQYIKDHAAVIIRVVPNGASALLGTPDNWQRPPRELPTYAETRDSDLQYRRASDAFDRSKKPIAQTNPAVQLPETWTAKLANGITVLGAVYDETPTVTLNLDIKIGARDVPLNKLGLATLTAAMLNESSKNYSNEAFSLALEKLGSSISVGAGVSYTTLSVRSLSKNLDATLQLAAERLFNPAFLDSDFQRLKAQTKQGIEAGKKQPANVANEAFQRLLFGANNALGMPAAGTLTSIDAITLDDVKTFYRDYYSPSVASVTVVGDVDQAELLSKLALFGNWQGKTVARPALQPFTQYDKARLYLIDKPGAAQSEIRIGMRSLPFDGTGEFYRLGLMNFNLGGAFNSRINLNLREDKGYTYGARSGFTGAEDYGYFSAGAGVRTDATDKSIIEFLNEIKQYASGGLRDDEVSFLKNAIGQSDARKYETPSQKLGFLFDQIRYNLGKDVVKQQEQILNTIDKAELNALASKHLDLNTMQIVVVGDKKSILAGLQALGYPIVELDADGKPL